MMDEEYREIRINDLTYIDDKIDYGFCQGFELGRKSVTLKEKTGHWIDDTDKVDAEFGRHTYKCSECGKYAEYFVSGTNNLTYKIKMKQHEKQQFILDNIRADIEERAKVNQNLNTDRARALYWCLDVIDKYKAESEEE